MRQVSVETGLEENPEESKTDLAILRSLQNLIEKPGNGLRRRRERGDYKGTCNPLTDLQKLN